MTPDGAQSGGSAESDQDRILAVMRREAIPLRQGEVSQWSGVSRSRTRSILLRLIDEGVVRASAYTQAGAIAYYGLTAQSVRADG